MNFSVIWKVSMADSWSFSAFRVWWAKKGEKWTKQVASTLKSLRIKRSASSVWAQAGTCTYSWCKELSTGEWKLEKGVRVTHVVFHTAIAKWWSGGIFHRESEAERLRLERIWECALLFIENPSPNFDGIKETQLFFTQIWMFLVSVGHTSAMITTEINFLAGMNSLYGGWIRFIELMCVLTSS